MHQILKMISLRIITSTNRPGRQSKAVARWIADLAKERQDYHVEVVDLGELNLPFMNEANHPVLQKYEFEHTKKWSRLIDSADAFIFVLAEYNYGIPAPLKNALDYLHHEWKYKPAGIVSYGGISGGVRSSQMLKQVLTTLNVMPIQEQVSLPFYSKYLDKEGAFHPIESAETSADVMLRELKIWTKALMTIRVEEKSK